MAGTRPRIHRVTGVPIRTSKEFYLKRKAIGITRKQAAYKRLCREMAAINKS